MRFRSVSRESPEIGLTPLIDVVFLLLIFFMVSTTFERRSELNVELPDASAGARQQDAAVIDVVIDAAGVVTIEGRVLDDPGDGELTRALADAAQGLNPAPPLVVSADARTPHQAVVTVMDAARRAGLYKLTFAAQRSAEPARR